MDTRTQRLMAEVIGSLADRECFLTQLEPCAEALGFDYFSYIVFSCYPASRPKMLIEGNFSANYLEDYRRQRVYLQDRLLSALTIPRCSSSGTLSRAADALAVYGAIRPVRRLVAVG